MARLGLHVNSELDTTLDLNTNYVLDHQELGVILNYIFNPLVWEG